MKEETVNIKRLKQYNSDEEEDPQQVANQATQRIEPWGKDIWNLQVMHEYLRANKLKQMIPTAFK